jgi:hypothetical protein
MYCHAVVSEFVLIGRTGDSMQPRTSAMGRILRCAIVGLILVTGCHPTETLFQSNFDSTALGQPPSHIQQVGTANIFGPPGSVVIVAPPVTPTGKWVQISRTGLDLVGLQGNFSQFRGDGIYNFSTILYIPSSSRNGVATIQFEQSVGRVSSFLHLDFTQANHVRIDDDEATTFGSFPRDQAFIVLVTLNINASSTAHIVLSGAGASGQSDYNILPPFRPISQQFGAIRMWMGFPWTGSFDATTIVVTRDTQ